MFTRRMRRFRATTVDLDLTAFMNLMVIMIPSLLINAVFTQVSVLNANQPGDAVAISHPSLPPELVLDVWVYPDQFVIKNRNQAVLMTLVGHDFAQLNAALMEVKRRYPQVADATLRIDGNVNYQDIISVIDAVRMTPSPKAGSRLVSGHAGGYAEGQANRYAMFPNVQLASMEGT